MVSKAEQLQSPFFTRSYGGYTPEQEEFYRSAIGKVARKTILDPMAGQAFALSKLAYECAQVLAGDINPAQLLLACLRAPEVIANRSFLAHSVAQKINRLKCKRRRRSEGFVEDWLSPSIKNDLRDYAEMVGLGIFTNPFLYNETFWTGPSELRFELAIVLLAARQITCYRSSDNVTWLKKGGLLRESRIVEPVERALARWLNYANEMYTRIRSHSAEIGSLSVQPMNVVEGLLGNAPKAHVIITSPPYANRMDYTKLWAPECEVLAVLCGTSVEQIRHEQIGTTVMRGRGEDTGEEKELPQVVRQSLDDIRTDRAASSHNYYYPFFRTYAAALSTGLRNITSRLRAKGRLIIFIRDTVRKDVLFPTGELVTRVLEDDCGCYRVDQKRHVIKSHVGYLRKGSANGLYGLAQQEWWLSFQKD